MPQVYTIATKNAFSVLDDSDSEDVILAEMPAENVKQQPMAPKQPTEQTGVDQPKRQPGNNNRRNNNNNVNGEQPKTDRPPRRPRNPDTDAAVDGERRAPRNPDNSAPRPYNTNNTNNTNGTEEGNRRRPGPTTRFVKLPASERLSGTGRGREMKKEGGGAHNWGNQTADFGGDATAKPETETDADALVVPVEVVEEAPKEEGPKTISYSAYKAEQEGKRAALPQRDEPEDAEADKAKYLQQGYEVYTKESKQPVSEKKTDEDEKSRPKAMHLAELAAQSGMQLRFGGDKRGPRTNNRDNRGEDRTKSPKNSTEEKKPKPASRHEINLADNQAFPTLEAH